MQEKKASTNQWLLTNLEQIAMAAFNRASWKPRTFCQRNPTNLGHPKCWIVFFGPKIAPKMDFFLRSFVVRQAMLVFFCCFSPGYARLNRASVVVSVMVQAGGKRRNFGVWGGRELENVGSFLHPLKIWGFSWSTLICTYVFWRLGKEQKDNKAHWRRVVNWTEIESKAAVSFIIE